MSQSTLSPQYSAETEKAEAAAQRAGLGRPGRAFANTKLGFAWREKDTDQLVFEFEGGLVGQRVGGPTDVFPWSRIAQVKRIGTHESKNGRYALTQFVYKVTRDDGVVLELRGSYVSPNMSKRADPASKGARYNRFGEDVVERVPAAKLPDARAALVRGESLAFGHVKINAQGIVMPKSVVAWNLIRDVRMRNGVLEIYQVDKKLSLLAVPAGTVPNLPLLLSLIEEQRGRGRSGA